VGVLVAFVVEGRVLVSYQRGLLDEVAQGVVVTLGADIANVQASIVGGPGWIYPRALLAVGLGCVDGPKQLQPVALCLSRDGGPPLELVRTSYNLTILPRGARGGDPNFREPSQGEVPRTPPSTHPGEWNTRIHPHRGLGSGLVICATIWGQAVVPLVGGKGHCTGR
jgi:hypothetical protein